MRGLLTNANRRALLASVVITPLGAMLHAPAAAAKAATTGSRTTVEMQPAANIARCKSLNFALLGDIMLGRYVDDQFEVAKRKTGAFGDVLPLLERLDPKCSIVAGNLECAGARNWYQPHLQRFSLLGLRIGPSPVPVTASCTSLPVRCAALLPEDAWIVPSMCFVVYISSWQVITGCGSCLPQSATI